MCGAEWSSAQQANIQTCEYWFDYDFEGRTSMAMNGSTTFEHSFDISDLPRGVHSIGMRFADSDGLYSPPFIKHFVIPALPEETFPDNHIAKMEYWFDYDFEGRQTLEHTDGNVAISLDLSKFAPGLHSFAYRAIDSHGLCSYPFVKHFVIPALPEETFPDNRITKMEYWFDYDFEGRQTLEHTDGNVAISLDVSEFAPGVHSFAYRAIDSRGLYSYPFVKHFVIPALPEETFPDNAIVKMEYWFDYDFEGRQTLEHTDGNVAISLDVSEFAPGVHSFAYRAIDSRGQCSYPFVKHFVIPSKPDEEITGIAYYEYWFNHGPRVHVDVDLQNPLTLENQIIEVKDVVPNKITEDYKFDVETGIISIDDNVFFGIQAFDNLGHPSSGVLSESFPFTVEMKPVFADIENGDTLEFNSPKPGYVACFKAKTEAEDVITLTLDSECKLDLYDTAGAKIEYKKETDNDTGNVRYNAIIPGTGFYAILWDGKPGVDVMNIAYYVKMPDADVNEDGKVNISDVVAVINTIAGTAYFEKADVNGDEKVNISDIVAVINYIAKGKH